ncbi:MAG: hypothetical protein WCY08_06065 [Rhodocyclaceae bacterium]
MQDPRYRIPLNTGSPGGMRPPGIVARALAVVATVAIGVLTFMFSIVVFAVVLAVGVIGWGYLWWKTRAIRKQMREAGFGQPGAGFDPNHFRHARPGHGQTDAGFQRGERGSSEHVVIEGEFIREVPDDAGKAQGGHAPDERR